MITFYQWLQKQPKEAESKALDYLNNKGFYCSIKSLTTAQQIEYIEMKNARDLHFKDCVRKLKNNLRQQKSAMRNPGVRPRTFKISDSSYEALKAIADIQKVTIHSVLERIIFNESGKFGIKGSVTGYALNNDNYSFESPYYTSASYIDNTKSIGGILARYLGDNSHSQYSEKKELMGVGDKLKALKDKNYSNEDEV